MHLGYFLEDAFVQTLGWACGFLKVGLCSGIFFGNEISQLFWGQVDGSTSLSNSDLKVVLGRGSCRKQPRSCK